MENLLNYINNEIQRVESADYFNELNSIWKDSNTTYIVIKTELNTLLRIKLQILTTIK